MTKGDFLRWMNDLSVRVPELGGYVKGLPKETLCMWYDDAFQDIDIQHALLVNYEIMRGEHEVDGFRRQRLCGVFVKRCGQMRARALERENATGVRVRGSSIDETLEKAGCGSAYRTVIDKMQGWRDEHPNSKRTPNELIVKWTEEALKA